MPLLDDRTNQANGTAHARQYAEQAQKLANLQPEQETEETGSTQAVQAKFVTPLDPVVETANGKRLPTIPLEEAVKLNKLKDHVDGMETPRSPPRGTVRPGKDGAAYGARLHSPPAAQRVEGAQDDTPEAALADAIPPSRTNPLFPPLPMYGPPTLARTLQCWFFMMVSSVLSLGFLLAICVGAAADGVPRVASYVRKRLMLQNPKKKRPFYSEEIKRAQERKAAQRAWVQQQRGTRTPQNEKGIPQDGEFVPTEGGPDPLVVDIGYYARRVGLDSEEFDVETEDGFIIKLVHLYNPREYVKPPAKSHEADGPKVFENSPRDSGFAEAQPFDDGNKKYPILMMHGLLQSAGAYCCNDDDSLAFYLAKSGYDIWLGNNRCGFEPKHTQLKYEDPRMWAWNIRQMGVMDLAALISRVLSETGFPKLALIAHSQGTTQTFVALAKEQRPEIGEKISVFCALAPAAYAGPLIGKIYFKVMQSIGPGIFRLIFGIHAFIPLMMKAHGFLPPTVYGWFGYHVFSFLFSWSDQRWDQGLRNRMFQWAPTYVSAESMRWWLGRECFAKQKCILATREEGRLEDKEDEEDDEVIKHYYVDREPHVSQRRKLQRNLTSFHCQTLTHQHHDSTRGKYAWYDDRFPPLALWVGGADNLVDGRRLLRRFDRGREPHVRVVHKKIIEGYEHLDVIWALDAIEKVGKEVREVIWRTADHDSQLLCRTPVGCEKPLEEDPDISKDVPMMHSGGRLRMASISEAPPALAAIRESLGHISEDGNSGRVPSTTTDHSREVEGEHEHVSKEAEEFGDGPNSGARAYTETNGSTERQTDGPQDRTNGRRTTGRSRKLSEAVFTDLQEKGNPLG
ncbi:hypothetical protein LTR78_004541 [Recurvomyces mirabilis]|uniref:Partial AB-hydrolase lipase domain-containing protein n=1 Tax=Recurvomyces mirabilis TaxID=574656 RepID=A0AAE1C2G8_9PEZI|nr:hypothetical protein LTR78_004541 [Recurvomyces mirabilis]KAK5152965.1 hypothetical protein LTS14_008073 [Recurvomyces mirabilis]